MGSRWGAGMLREGEDEGGQGGEGTSDDEQEAFVPILTAEDRRGGELTVRVAIKVVLAALTVQLGFGSYPVVVKACSDGRVFNMVTFSMYRDVLATPMLLLAAKSLEGGQLHLPKTKAEWRVFAWLGLSGIGGQQLMFIMGLYYTSPSLTSVWQQTVPVWATAFGIMLGQEPLPNVASKVGALRVIGFVLSISGAVVMNLVTAKSDPSDPHRNPALGTLFLMGNTFSTGLFLATQRSLLFSSSSLRRAWISLSPVDGWASRPVHVTAFSYSFGGCFAAMICLAGVLQFGPDHPETNSLLLPSSAVLPLLFALVVPSGICYVLISYASMHAPSSVVSSFWPFQVPVALGLSSALGFSTLNLQQELGGALLVLGLLCVSGSSLLTTQR